MAKVDVIMPQMGESIAEGTITKWLKRPGDEVKRDEPLFEISTDKVDAEIPAPASGRLAEVLVQEGATVAVNTVVARIETDGKAGARGPEPVAAAVSPEPVKPAEPAPAAEPVPAAVPGPRRDGEPEARGAGPATREERLRTRSTPLVRRIAAEHGIDIATIPGTGIHGRVTKRDLLAFLERGAPARAAAPAAPAAPAVAAAEPVEEGVLVAPIHGATLRIRIPPVPIRENDRVEEMSVMRQRIMEHMIMSRRISAHVTTVFEIDFERVVQLRNAWKADFEARGVKLTYTPFVVKAVVEGLKAYPVLNASVVGNKIVYHGDINIGIAVAIDDGRGLIVPVIKNADHLSLFGIAKAAQDLAERARTKRLQPEEVQGGTFTITNPGVFGSLFGTPIINQPQVAILGTGVVEKRPVVIHDAIAIRHRAYFGISYDHRLVDGAMADFFMNKVKEVIENFPEDAA